MLGRRGAAKTLAAALVVVLGFGVSGQIAAAPPVEAFGKLPDFSHVKISPNGTHLAAVRWVDGAPILAIYTLKQGQSEGSVNALSLDVSDKVEEKVSNIYWLSDSRIGVAISFEAERWNVGTLETRLMSVAIDLSDVRQIPRRYKTRSKYFAQIQDRILDFLPEDSDHILMALDRKGTGQELNVYRVNIHSGGAESIARGDKNVSGYMMDRQGQIRLKFVYKKKKKRILIRENNSDSWTKFQETGRLDHFEYPPAGFSNDPNILYVYQENSAGMRELYKYNLKRQTLGEQFFSV